MNTCLIAGPPGIGKSTNAKKMIPKRVSIIDQDLAGYQYKKLGFGNYRDLASMSSNHKIRENLFTNHDFALELNLGFASHYDYLKSIASAAASKKIHLLLFFTDSLDLCLDRAKLRHLNGGHEVKAEIVTEMYGNTVPLFLQNQNLFDSVRLIDVTYDTIIEPTCKTYLLPIWITSNSLKPYLV